MDTAIFRRESVRILRFIVAVYCRTIESPYSASVFPVTIPSITFKRNSSLCTNVQIKKLEILSVRFLLKYLQCTHSTNQAQLVFEIKFSLFVFNKDIFEE